MARFLSHTVTRGTYHRNISCCQSGHSVMARSVLPYADIKYIRQYVTRAHNHPHYLTPVVNTYYRDIVLIKFTWTLHTLLAICG